jgi:hypothetical protein
MIMSKPTTGKLTLKKQTLRMLQVIHLGAIRGGCTFSGTTANDTSDLKPYPNPDDELKPYPTR